MKQRILRRLRSTISQTRLSYRRWRYTRIEESGKPFSVRLPGNRTMKMYPQGQIPELLYTSNFEWDEIQLIAAVLGHGMTVLDIGANVGLYSVFAGKLVGPTGKVWAFEPSSEASKRLKDNLALNQVSCVEVFQIALSDVEDASLVLKRDPGYRDGDRYLATRKTPNVQLEGKVEDAGDDEIVPVTTLDHFFSQHNDVLPHIDFIKMDIEGGEFAVFRGARQLLQANPDVVIMFECTPQDCHVNGHTQEDVFEYLRALGFRTFCRSHDHESWTEEPSSLKNAGNVWACSDATKLPAVR